MIRTAKLTDTFRHPDSGFMLASVFYAHSPWYIFLVFLKTEMD